MRLLSSLLILAMSLPVALLAQKNPESEEESIRIGAVLSFSGYDSSYDGEAFQGFRLAIEIANRDGGIAGRQIEVDTADAHSASSGAIEAFDRVAEHSVSAVFGPVASGRMMVLKASSNRTGIPVVSSYATNPEVTRSGNNLFHSSYEDSQQGTAMARYAARRLGLKRIAIVVEEGSAFCEILAGTFKSAFDKEGGKITGQSVFSLGDGPGYEEHYTTVLREIMAGKPDALYLPGYTSGEFVELARSRGIEIPILGSDGWEGPHLFADSKREKALEGCYLISNFAADEPLPVVRDFTRLYRERFGTEPSVFAALGYDAGLLILAAIRKAGSSRPEVVRDALIGLTIEGVTGRITIRDDRESTKPLAILRITKGKFKFLERVEM